MDALAGRWHACLQADDGTWQDVWRRYAGPVGAGRLVIVPPWSERPVGVGADRILLDIDPGRSFGSGHHPSTRLCLLEVQRWLGRSEAPPAVLDVGSGTGVLAVAAAALGASPVVALDVDPAAAALTAANAGRNGVRVLAVAGTIDSLRAPPAGPGFDVVLANLGGAVAPVALAPALVGALAPGGHLVVGGLLEEQRDPLRRAFGDLDAAHEAVEEGWAVVVLRRPGRGWAPRS